MTRLRIVFLSVTLVLVCATVTSYIQAKNLRGATSVLTEKSVPVFVQAQDIERSLTSLVLAWRAAESARDIESLRPFEQAMTAQLRLLNSHVNELAQRQALPDAAVNMERALNRIDKQIARLFDLKREIFALEDQLNEVGNILQKSQESARKALEQIAYETSVRLDSDVARYSAALESFEQVYSRNLRQANAVTELTLEIDALVAAAARARNLPTPGELAGAEQAMRFKSRGISVLLSQFSPGNARRQLAEETIRIRDLIFGEAGILDLTTRLQTAQATFASQISEEKSAIAAVSESVGALVSEARQRVGETTFLLDATAEKVVIFLIAASLASVLVFVVANALVVERQINRRMSRLTRAVSAIAANETDYRVDVEGDDELGEMAQALETFKSTAEELRRSNTELEKFAYVAAHDLRSPLRAIQDISEWLLEDEENHLSAESRENMDLLKKRVDRLNLLLTDLLAYSRVGKENEDLTQLSLPELVQSTREMLEANSRYRISYSGTCQDIVTYATPLRQILLNLISNSIKHNDRDSGEIKITGAIAGDRLRVSVEDDGPGIEPVYHDRIFGLFQTLRPRDEVEGSGLGLAIIAKLVDHYGGRISVHSDPASGRGTRFEFDMPIKPGAVQPRNLAA